MRAAQENYNPRGQLAHVEKEQVDIKADIKIIQHDLVTIKENMATKSDIVAVKADISSLHHKIEVSNSELKSTIDAVENKLEAKTDLIKSDIGWLKAINIAILATVLGIAFAPIAQNMFKAPVQEVITDKK